MSASPRLRLSRETRLLLIVITLSAVVLGVLSRFRFPDVPRRDAARSSAPLERLAARATYDELASIIAELDQRVSPHVDVLRVETSGQQRFVPALRVRPDLALAHVSGESRIIGLVGGAAPEVVAFDSQRELVLVRIVPDPGRVLALGRRGPVSTAPRYVAAVEGTRGGPTLRPVFLGRTDPLRDDRFGAELLVLGGVLQASPGSLIFGLDGSFVALCIMEEGFIAGVPGHALEAAVQRMLAPLGP
jgi:hypothetical protein